MRFKILQDPCYLIDGLVDCVAVGLYELGHQVNLPPHKSYLLGEKTLPPAFECFTGNIENYDGQTYDLSIVALPYSGAISGQYIVLDGGDTPDISYRFLKNCLVYFKREKARQGPSIFPLSRTSVARFIKQKLIRPYQRKIFGLSLSTLVKPVDAISEKEWDVGYIGSDKYGRRQFIQIVQNFDVRHYIRVSSYYMAPNQVMPMSSYLEILKRCRAVLCPYGAGQDTYRLWETLASGAIPLLQQFTIEVARDLTHGENALIFNDTNSLITCLEILKNNDTRDMAANALHFFNSYHTPKCRAQQLLNVLESLK